MMCLLRIGSYLFLFFGLFIYSLFSFQTELTKIANYLVCALTYMLIQR